MGINNTGEPANQYSANERNAHAGHDQVKKINRENENSGRVKGVRTQTPADPRKQQKKKGCTFLCSKCCLNDVVQVSRKESPMTPPLEPNMEPVPQHKLYSRFDDTISLSSGVSDVASGQEGMSAYQILQELPRRKPRIYIAHDDTISLTSSCMDDNIGRALQEKHTKDKHFAKDGISLSSALFGANNEPADTEALLTYADGKKRTKLYSSKKDSISLSSSICFGIADKLPTIVVPAEDHVVASVPGERSVVSVNAASGDSQTQTEPSIIDKTPSTATVGDNREKAVTVKPAMHSAMEQDLVSLALEHDVAATQSTVFMPATSPITLQTPRYGSVISMKQLLEPSTGTETMVATSTVFTERRLTTPLESRIISCTTRSESVASIKTVACSSTEKLVKSTSHQDIDTPPTAQPLAELTMLSVDGQSVANILGKTTINDKSSNYVVPSAMTASASQVNVLNDADLDGLLPHVLSAETQIVLYARQLELEIETRPNVNETSVGACATATVIDVSKSIVNESTMHNADTSTILDEVVQSIVDEIIRSIVESLKGRIIAIPQPKTVDEIKEVAKPVVKESPTSAIASIAQKIVDEVLKKDYDLASSVRTSASGTSSIRSDVEGYIVAVALNHAIQEVEHQYIPETQLLELVDDALVNNFVSTDNIYIPERLKQGQAETTKATKDIPQRKVTESHINASEEKLQEQRNNNYTAYGNTDAASITPRGARSVKELMERHNIPEDNDNDNMTPIDF